MSSKLNAVLEKIKKDYKVDIPNAREASKMDRIFLDSPGLNYSLGGGWVNGRMYYFQGPESGGKTTLSCYIASQIQKKYSGHNTVVYCDFEYAFDADHASQLGLDVDNNFILLRPLNGEDGFEMIRDLVNTGEVGLVVIDSITTLSSKGQQQDANKASFGGQATVLSNNLRMINPYLYNNKCSLIMISQERANVGVMYGAPFKGTGGYSPRFYSSWMSRVTRTGDIVNPETKELIGIEMRVRNTKNKIGIPNRDANLKLYFDSGINSDDEYIDYLKTLGLVKQKGAYYSNEDWIADDGTQGMKVCGLGAVADYLNANPKLYEQVKKDINTLISGYNILDATEQTFDDDTERAIIEEMNQGSEEE